jgi:hypothetical protein
MGRFSEASLSLSRRSPGSARDECAGYCLRWPYAAGTAGCSAGGAARSGAGGRVTERLLSFRRVGAAEHRRRSTSAIAVVPRPAKQAARYNFGVVDARFIGVDLAWREGNADLVANETGVAVIDRDGKILDAGWTCGVEADHRLGGHRRRRR